MRRDLMSGEIVSRAAKTSPIVFSVWIEPIFKAKKKSLFLQFMEIAWRQYLAQDIHWARNLDGLIRSVVRIHMGKVSWRVGIHQVLLLQLYRFRSKQSSPYRKPQCQCEVSMRAETFHFED